MKAVSLGPLLGRRERRKRATRKALLDAALELIGEQGVYDTRVEDVTERADVGKGAFYNYFDSKTALVAALVADAAEQLERGYLGARPAGRRLSERLAAVVEAHERFFRDSPARAILFHQARGLLELGHEAVPELRAAFTDYLERLGAYLHPGRASRAQLLEAASLVAGAIAGYRSFGRAAGLRTRPGPVQALLVDGLKARADSTP